MITVNANLFYNYFVYLSNGRAWLLDHLTPSLPVLTDDVISQVFIESSALEQVVSIHSGMAAEWAGQTSGGILPKSYVLWLGESRQQPWLSPGASGLDPQWKEFPMAFQVSCLLGHDSIFVNKCGNNALCSSESQGDFWLG
ncbi:uncharacterized protein TNCV_5046461 [Trichonephila clavipes]|uniref:Uncharacterized protein n=1 Tax=Trichonephila clavipes TaxID=2585209 RepID=A0A8X6WHN0_TRICX|nr:uncharacterized protein TNCV_5046461 [Trichonephila clavipes]